MPEAAAPLLREVHGVAHAATIPADEQLRALLKGADNEVRRCFQRVERVAIRYEVPQQVFGFSKRSLENLAHLLEFNRSLLSSCQVLRVRHNEWKASAEMSATDKGP